MKDIRELKFVATTEKGEVSAILTRPAGATRLLVLGHDASTNMRHRTMQSIADALASVNIATFRYNFPYSEKGGGRNSTATCVATVRSAVLAARRAAPDLALLAGGHSFGGRMTTTAQAEEPLEGVSGLVLFSFPLHLAGRPDIARSGHLSAIGIPMLFLTGTRDQLADLALFKPVIARLGGRAELYLIDTADHSYKVLKRARASEEDVFDEMATAVSLWSEHV